MTASISDDIAAIEAALAAGPTQGPWHVEPQEDGRWEVCTASPGAWILDMRSTSEATEAERAEDTANVELMATCDPARLRRVLDTMRVMGEALEACLPSIDPYSRERAEADAALAAYRGETK